MHAFPLARHLAIAPWNLAWIRSARRAAGNNLTLDFVSGYCCRSGVKDIDAHRGYAVFPTGISPNLEPRR